MCSRFSHLFKSEAINFLSLTFRTVLYTTTPSWSVWLHRWRIQSWVSPRRAPARTRSGSTWTTWTLWWWSTRHSATTQTQCLSHWVPLEYWSSSPLRHLFSRSERQKCCFWEAFLCPVRFNLFHQCSDLRFYLASRELCKQCFNLSGTCSTMQLWKWSLKCTAFRKRIQWE